MTTRLGLGSALATVVVLWSGMDARADHRHGIFSGGHYHGGYSGGGYGSTAYYGGYSSPSFGYGYVQPHVDQYPGGYVPHFGHYHYVPPHTDLHVGPRSYPINPWSGRVSPFHHHH